MLLDRAGALEQAGQVAEAVARARSGHVVLIEGEPGIGKTAVLHAIEEDT
jgi:MoxR-like ATPase